MKTYRLKLTALTPIHIGTGEVYEPTNFVIDDGYLYEFDEVLFYQSLNELEKKEFFHKLQDYIQIIDFYKNHKSKAKQIYRHKVVVTKKVENKYNTKINKDGTKNKNQLEIQKTYKNPNNHFLVIPGSSLKGVFDTFLHIYNKPEVVSNEIRQQLHISDSIKVNGNAKIGFCYRKHKDPNKKAKSQIPQIIEIIPPNTTFVATIKTEFDFERLKQFAKSYYKNRPNSRYQENNNSFVIRVGKFSGKEYVTDIKDVKNSYGKSIATHTLYEDNSPFGWLKIELINEDEYNRLSNIANLNEQKYFDDLNNRVKKIKDFLNQQLQKQKEELAKKEALKKAEEEAKRKEEQELKEKLSKMSPLDRKIFELQQNHPNPNDTIDIIIFNAIKNGLLDEFKCEALKKLKEEMRKLKKWIETSKKPQKDKKYKRTQEVIKMLGECKE
jgi:CRISPR/Cas system CSM-associated protein Csm5 (group 7 of RAMP superfamily)